MTLTEKLRKLSYIFKPLSPKTGKVTLYHGTRNPDLCEGGQFFPLTHFGSLDAACSRLKNLPLNEKSEHKIIQVELDPGNALELTDPGGGHGLATWKKILTTDSDTLTSSEAHYVFDDPHTMDSYNVKSELQNDTFFDHTNIPHINPYSPYDEQSCAQTCLSMQRLIQTLEKKGYSCVKYTNRFEDPGHTSYITFRPEKQLKRLRTISPTDPSFDIDTIKKESRDPS